MEKRVIIPSLAAALLASVVAFSISVPASAQSLGGLCLELQEWGCTPRYLPFTGLSIDFCEETCELTNPVNVRGMNGVLYGLSCQADYNTPYDGQRVLILRQYIRDGVALISWIDRRETLRIVPCP